MSRRDPNPLEVSLWSLAWSEEIEPFHLLVLVARVVVRIGGEKRDRIIATARQTNAPDPGRCKCTSEHYSRHKRFSTHSGVGRIFTPTPPSQPHPPNNSLFLNGVRFLLCFVD